MAVTYCPARAGGALQNPAYRLADISTNEGFGVIRRAPRHIRVPDRSTLTDSAPFISRTQT